MAQFRINAYVEIGGYYDIEAKTYEEAEKIALEKLEQETEFDSIVHREANLS